MWMLEVVADENVVWPPLLWKDQWHVPIRSDFFVNVVSVKLIDRQWFPRKFADKPSVVTNHVIKIHKNARKEEGRVSIKNR